MSTRSAIIVKDKETGNYRGVYCHFDGYLDGVGYTLRENFNSYKDAYDIVALGDLSQLAECKRVNPIGKHSYDSPESGTIIAYHRDRGEEEGNPIEGDTVQSVECQIGHNGYVYVFENDEWSCNGEPIVLPVKN
jgi:hypothetical protein